MLPISRFLILALLLAMRMQLAADDARVVEITASHDDAFRVAGEKSPVIRARPGEMLKLRITAERGTESARDGAVHSLVIRDLRNQGWDLRLFEGTHDYVVRAPDAPGEYLVECTVKCGRGHEDMHMKLIVRGDK